MKLNELIICLFDKIRFRKGCDIDLHSRLSFTTQYHVDGNGKISTGFGFHAMRNVTLHSATEGEITIGKNVFLNENCMVVAHKKIEISDNVTIGPNTVIFDHDHNTTLKSGYISKPIIIEKNVWIGSNCVILKGVNIGENSIIAAGTVVTKDIPSNCIAKMNIHLSIKKIE